MAQDVRTFLFIQYNEAIQTDSRSSSGPRGKPLIRKQLERAGSTETAQMGRALPQRHRGVLTVEQ